jgi:hypothetical protein
LLGDVGPVEFFGDCAKLLDVLGIRISYKNTLISSLSNDPLLF